MLNKTKYTHKKHCATNIFDLIQQNYNNLMVKISGTDIDTYIL